MESLLKRFPSLRSFSLCAATLLVVTQSSIAVSQEPPSGEMEIGTIDTYGLRKLTTTEIHSALTFQVGQKLRHEVFAESESRIKNLPNVDAAHITEVCCQNGKLSVFVGVREKGSKDLVLREAPQGAVKLTDEMTEAGRNLNVTLSNAMSKGIFQEDDTAGHALSLDPASRAIQEHFIQFANNGLPLIRKVLRESSDNDHRALAAQIIGYAKDKQSVVDNLLFALNDPNALVRNNAMRSLLVFKRLKPTPDNAVPTIPFEPFIAYLDSFSWTDLNKSSYALYELSANRDPTLLKKLREQALPSLIEIARWKSKGHAYSAVFVLGRVAGMSDDEISKAFKEDDIETIIASVKDPKRSDTAKSQAKK